MSDAENGKIQTEEIEDHMNQEERGRGECDEDGVDVMKGKLLLPCFVLYVQLLYENLLILIHSFLFHESGRQMRSVSGSNERGERIR